MTSPNAYPPFYDGDISPALDITDPGTAVLLGHTGTLMTDGYGNGNVGRTVTRGTYTTELGPDTSAAAINPFLKPDLTTLPDGYVAAPVYDGPVY